jgi:hypothetical protein
MDKVGLLSLATALPPYTVEQPVAKAKARELFGGRKALFDRLATGVRQRRHRSTLHRRADWLV